MWAARILGWDRVGLGDILKSTFDVRTNKRYQRYNWGKRPLDPQALQYACLDTHYLLALRDLQADALRQLERWEEGLEVFNDVAASDPMPPNTFNLDDFWRVKGVFDLSDVEQAVLAELYAWRDHEARRQDRPPFKVVGNRTLIAIAQARPHSPAALKGTQGVRAHHIRRYGEQIVGAVRRGERSGPPKPPPPPPRRPQAEVVRFQALRNWRKRVAAKRGVDPDVVVGNAVLWALAEQRPKTLEALEDVEGFGPWKRKAYGEAILEVLRRAR
jgi:ribonuclease D